MGGSLTDAFDETRLATVSAQIAAAIDAASLGSGSWDAVPAALSDAFPGSFGSLWSMNFARNELNFFASHNIDPDFERSYVDHFAYINPWADFWKSAKTGFIGLSEESSPARSFSDSEFYNDWLLPQKDVEAAAALKLVGDKGEVLQFLVHFPIKLSEQYGRAAVEVLTRVRENLSRSIELAQVLRANGEDLVASAALVERSRSAAFVIGYSRHVLEANQMGVELLSTNRCVAAPNDRFVLLDQEADSRFGKALAVLASGLAPPRITFRTADGPWQLMMAGLPEALPAFAGALSFLPPERMVLVLVTELNATLQEVGELSALSTGFGLTPAEIVMCRRLLSGDTVADAAEQMGITIESARTRLKIILHKTQTSRQSQLMLLLSKLR